MFDLTLAAVLAAVEKLDILLTLLLLRSMAERRKGLAKGLTVDIQTCQARKQVSCVKTRSKKLTLHSVSKTGPSGPAVTCGAVAAWCAATAPAFSRGQAMASGALPSGSPASVQGCMTGQFCKVAERPLQLPEHALFKIAVKDRP